MAAELQDLEGKFDEMDVEISSVGNDQLLNFKKSLVRW